MVTYYDKVEEHRKSKKIRPLSFTKKTQELIRKFASDTKSWSIEQIRHHLNCSYDKAEKIWKEVKKKRRDLMLAVSEETDDQNLKVKGLHSIQKTGIIYLVEHELYDGWLKCGMTVNMKSRLKSYNLCDPLKRYMVVASKVVKDRRKSELDLIHELSNRSSMKNGEWFKIQKDEAKSIFEQV